MLTTRIFTTVTRSSRQALQQTTRTCASLDNRPEMVKIAHLIEDKIKENKVMVFSKSHCPYCTKAKQVFAELIEENKLTPKDYEIMEIEDNPHCDLIQDRLQQLTGAKSVPRVFINQRCLGGAEEVMAAYISGELEKLMS